MFKAVFIILSFSCCIFTALAEEIEIMSDSLFVDLTAQTITYNSNVKVTSNQKKILADKLLLATQNSQLRSMHATGQPALYIADMLQAQALKIEFNQAENNLHLLESAKIINKQSSIQGKHLIIDLNENLLIATSSPTKNKIILDLEANK